MAQRRVSFIVRVIVSDTNALLRGAIYQVPSEQPIYFQSWDECSRLLSEAIRAGAFLPDDDQSRTGQADEEPEAS